MSPEGRGFEPPCSTSEVSRAEVSQLIAYYHSGLLAVQERRPYTILQSRTVAFLIVPRDGGIILCWRRSQNIRRLQINVGWHGAPAQRLSGLCVCDVAALTGHHFIDFDGHIQAAFGVWDRLWRDEPGAEFTRFSVSLDLGALTVTRLSEGRF